MQPASRPSLLRLVLPILLATSAAAAPQWLSEPVLVSAPPVDQLGSALALDGEALLVGAAASSPGAVLLAGTAHVYRKTPGWSEARVLVASDASQGAAFGSAVALDGAAAIVGAPAAAGRGAVYAFNAVSGSQLGKLVPADLADGDAFGSSVAIDGGVILAGAPSQVPAPQMEGAVYAFGADGSQLAKLTASDGGSFAFFGCSVAIQGTTVVVGARGAVGPGGAQRGAVYVFDRTSWTQQQKLVASDWSGFDQFGRSVALDGDTLLVCSRDAGYVFVRQGATWVQEARLSGGWPNGANGGMVGALAGDRALLGLPLDPELGANAGSASVFRRDGTLWSFERRVVAPDGQQGDHFGGAVALSGTHAVVAAHGDTGTPPSSRGSLHPYELDANPTFCHDAALSACPCGNAGSPDTGCDNPQGTGGVRAEFVAVDRGAQEATLVAGGFPLAGEPTAIAIRSAALVTPTAFFDGVRCIATSGLVRMAASTASSGVSRHEIRHLTTPGTYHYQVWYRSPPSFCTASPSNVSSGDSLTW